VGETVLFVHGIGEIGGAERELLIILDHLSGMGYRPNVVCPDQGKLAEELQRRSVEACGGLFPPWRKWYAYPQRGPAIHRLRQLLEARQPALIHVNDIWWVPQTLRARAGSGGSLIPLVAHVRQGIESRKVRLYELDQADLVMAVSHRVERSLQEGGVRPERIETVHSGLDLRKIQDNGDPLTVRSRFGISPDVPLLGTVANLFHVKGLDMMIKAMPAILRLSPRCHYIIVGKGDVAYETELRDLTKRLGVDGHVHFAGFQESVYPILEALDLYVHPARMEGFGIALLEAMAMGRAVVATRAGGIPEIVIEGETALLVAPGDPEALASAVSALLGDPMRRTAFGKAGRRRVEERFTVEVMMGTITRAYARLLESRRPAGVTGPA
jgi:glycosyltransferase involved in cell wall biosynthesis